MTDLNKHIERKDIAAMLSSYKDELDKTSTSLPRGNMSLLMQLFPHLAENAETISKQVDSFAQFCSKVNTVPIVDRNEPKKKVTHRLKRIHLSDEKRSLHFAHKQKVYDVEVSEKLLELEEWYDDFETFERRTPNAQDFADKLDEMKREIEKLDSRINPDLFFKDGPDDVVLCGRILIKNETKWNSSDEQKAVCLMSALQWLLRQQAKYFEQQTHITTSAETKLSKPVNSFDEAFKILLTKYLELNVQGTNTKINDKQWNKNRLIVATMYVLQSRGTLPTTDETMYAELVAPIVAQDPENLRKNINHHLQDIKPYGCNLKCLNEEYIRNNIPDDGKGMTRREFTSRWKGMFELIDGYIDGNEDLVPLRGNSAETPRVICADI